MQTKFLSVIFLFAAFGATQDVDLDDIPKVCQQACQDISRLSEDCDDQNEDDTAELNCICNADSAQQLANSCAACVKANIQSDDDDDDDEEGEWIYVSTSKIPRVTSCDIFSVAIVKFC